MEYRFKVCGEENMAGTSQICELYEGFDGCEGFMKNEAMALGQLKTRFGEPLHTSKDMECLFDYCILATDEEGNEIILTAYHGPTGPAIGGDSRNPSSKDAARALAKYVQSAELTDYKISGYYYDAPVPIKITLGVKKGKPYCKGGISILGIFNAIFGYIRMIICFRRMKRSAS